MKTWCGAFAGFSLITLLANLQPVPGMEILKLATSTSTSFTGILDHLHSPFEKKFGVRIHTIAVGTGKALRLGENGDVDVVMVHSPNAEEAFVSRGSGVNRRNLMYNNFVIVGPISDPAGISGTDGVAAALRRIGERKAVWVSRGDDSGTHKKEITLWRAAGLKPEGKWYRSLGQGIGGTLKVADEIGAYALSDRGSFIFFAARGKVDLQILLEGGRALFNPYSIIAVNPKRNPHVRYDLAMKYIRFLTSARGQELIGSFRLKGNKLFYPFMPPVRPRN